MKSVVEHRFIYNLDETLHLFRHQIAIHILHQFVGTDKQQPARFAHVETYIEKYVGVPVHLNAIPVATVITLQEKGVDTDGVYRQKLLHKMIKLYVASAYNQING